MNTIPLLLLAAFAQDPVNVTSSPEREDTVRIMLSGQVELDYIYRSPEITAFIPGFSGGPLDSDGETTFEGLAAARMDIDLSDLVSATVEVGSRRAQAGMLDEWGGGTPEGIRLREAHVRLGEFLLDDLHAVIGISSWNFDVRGRGRPFAFGLRRAQPLRRNLSPFADSPDVLGSGVDSLTLRAGFPAELDPVGLVVTYERAQLVLNLVALPVVVEGGTASQDEALYATDLWYLLGDGDIRVGLIFAASSFGDLALPPGGATIVRGSPSSVFTTGAGFALKNFVLDGLEVYGEAYYQFGDAGRADVDGDGSLDDELDADGYAFQAGAEYAIPDHKRNLRFGANVTYFSGDEDLAGDDSVDAFLSYENVSDLLVLEDMYFGLDWDTNYMALKLSAGGAVTIGAIENDLELRAIVGLARTAKDVAFPDGWENDLGTEVDIYARWILGTQTSLRAAAGFLRESDVLHAFMGGDANPDASDDAAVGTLGIDLTF